MGVPSFTGLPWLQDTIIWRNVVNGRELVLWAHSTTSFFSNGHWPHCVFGDVCTVCSGSAMIVLSFLPFHPLSSFQCAHVQRYWCMDLSGVGVCWAGDLLLSYSCLICKFKGSNQITFFKFWKINVKQPFLLFFSYVYPNTPSTSSNPLALNVIYMLLTPKFTYLVLISFQNSILEHIPVYSTSFLYQIIQNQTLDTLPNLLLCKQHIHCSRCSGRTLDFLDFSLSYYMFNPLIFHISLFPPLSP